jgi:hypothetical protein
MKRPLALGVAWVASAAAAVGLGFLAVSLVGASASPGAQQTVVNTSTSAPATPTSVAVSPSGEKGTVGGTVYASCVGGTPDLASAPAPGWWVDDSSTTGEVEFRNGTQKVKIHAICVDGGPQFSDEGPRADDSGGGSSSTSPAPTTPAPSSPAGSTSGGDDPSGRHGGGHGSDDPAGDDSSGRDGGGHGSDG